jgi:hypothetical protein
MNNKKWGCQLVPTPSPIVSIEANIPFKKFVNPYTDSEQKNDIMSSFMGSDQGKRP